MINTAELGLRDEGIIHFGAVRVRVNGAGVLIPTLFGFDRVKVQQIGTFPMSALPGIEPRVLCNFTSQRAFLRFETVNIDDVFNINRIVVYVRPLWSEYPG